MRVSKKEYGTFAPIGCLTLDNVGDRFISAEKA